MSGSQKRLVDGHKTADTHSFISPFSGAHSAHNFGLRHSTIYENTSYKRQKALIYVYNSTF